MMHIIMIVRLRSVLRAGFIFSYLQALEVVDRGTVDGGRRVAPFGKAGQTFIGIVALDSI
jgi:hypothetical protein